VRAGHCIKCNGHFDAYTYLCPECARTEADANDRLIQKARAAYELEHKASIEAREREFDAQLQSVREQLANARNGNIRFCFSCQKESRTRIKYATGTCSQFVHPFHLSLVALLPSSLATER
jgi:hypothetical protein